MFECTCRAESWKQPGGNSGQTVNAVSIFHIDREHQESLALREKVLLCPHDMD